MLKSRYGLRLADYDAMLLKQDGRCAICLRKMGRVCVDHDHVTGKVRALLCVGCNLTVGFIERRLPILGRILEYIGRY